MATVKALKTGVWSDPTVWDTGSLPGATDHVYANGFTITIDVSVTALSIRTMAATGINPGGSFTTALDGLTIMTDVLAGTSTALVYTGAAGNTLTILGNATGGSGASAMGVNHTGAGTVNFTGNATGGSGTTSVGVNNTGAGTVNLVGNATGGSSNIAYGVRNMGPGTVNMTGNATGGTVSAAPGAYNTAGGTFVLNGIAIPSATAAGAVNFALGTMRVTTAMGNSNPGSTVSAVEGTNLSGLTVVKHAVYGPNGQTPLGGYVRFDNASTSSIQVTKENGLVQSLIDVNDLPGQLPAPGHVRAGTTYNNGSKVGTLVVPAPAHVRLGIATDHTVGTAQLTAADFWNLPLADVTQGIGLRMKNVATVQSTGDQLAALTPN